MQTEFFGAALGGPESYSGLDLARSHQGRGITTQHFTRFVRHMVETLREQGVADDDISQVEARLATYVNDITGAGTFGG
jgi:hemoglobin